MKKDKLKKVLEKITIVLTLIIVGVGWYGRIIKTKQGFLPTDFRNLQIILVLVTMIEVLFLTYLDRKKNALYLIIFYILMAIVYIAFKGAGRI